MVYLTLAVFRSFLQINIRTCIILFYDGADLQSIIDELNHRISQEAAESANRFTASHVKAAVDRLKPHKSDGCRGLLT